MTASSEDHTPQQLLAGLPCGVLSFTDDGTVQFANQTLATLLAYNKEEIEGKHIERLLTVPGRIFYQTHLFPLLRLRGHADEIFLLLRRRSGEEVGALVNAIRREHDGEVRNDCVLMEVRERRKYEDELLRAKRAAEAAQAAQAAQATQLLALNDALVARGLELEAARHAADLANKAKSDFLAAMSHELRTPLNAIAGHAQLIGMGIYGTISNAQRDALERIERNQRHLLRLINDILNLARIESGRLEFAIESVPLVSVITEIAPMIEPQITAKAITYVVHLAADVPNVLADREKLQQILLNLLSNAVKFTPSGGAITIDAARSVEQDGSVLLRVIDTGSGIPGDRVETIFEPFVQVDATGARGRQGIGLGLTISRNFARAMGGDVSATSALGRGSEFCLRLRGAPEAVTDHHLGSGAESVGVSPVQLTY